MKTTIITLILIISVMIVTVLTILSLFGRGPLGNYPCNADQYSYYKIEVTDILGESMTVTYKLPTQVKDFSILSNRGSYRLAYIDCTNHWKTLRVGILRYRIINKTDL
jgi:hypothetical protein